MTVITISRQFGSGGNEIANRICEFLGYQVFDKRLVARAAAEAGLSEQELVDYSEENYKVRNFMDRLFGRSQTVAQVRVWREDASGVRTAEEVRLDEEAALSLVQTAVRSAHKLGNMVIVGRGGQALLKDEPGVLHIRIEAPLEERIQRVKEQMKSTGTAIPADIQSRRAAQDWILERDFASADYIKRFYGCDWDDPLLYHLVLNTGKLSLEQAAQVIVKLESEIRQNVEAAGVAEPG
jgi:cytidylate kinase